MAAWHFRANFGLARADLPFTPQYRMADYAKAPRPRTDSDRGAALVQLSVVQLDEIG
jgi:hypothetical protein